MLSIQRSCRSLKINMFSSVISSEILSLNLVKCSAVPCYSSCNVAMWFLWAWRVFPPPVPVFSGGTVVGALSPACRVGAAVNRYRFPGLYLLTVPLIKLCSRPSGASIPYQIVVTFGDNRALGCKTSFPCVRSILLPCLFPVNISGD